MEPARPRSRGDRVVAVLRRCAAIGALLALPLAGGCATTRMSALGPYSASDSELAPAELEGGRWYALVAWTDSGSVTHAQVGRVRRLDSDSLELAIQVEPVGGWHTEDRRRMAADSVRTVRTRQIDAARTAVYGMGFWGAVIVGVVAVGALLGLLALQSL